MTEKDLIIQELNAELKRLKERNQSKKVKNRKVIIDFCGSPCQIKGDCPKCGCENISATNTDYCPACGQKLGWSE